MSPARAVLRIVAAAAVVAVGGTVGVTLLQSARPVDDRARRGHEAACRACRRSFSSSASAATPRRRRSRTLLHSSSKGKAQQAAAIFARYHSLQAQIGLAFARLARTAGSTS